MHGERLPRVTDRPIVLPRIIDVLNGWAPITIVRGMRGYGKTTQIASWLRDLRPRPPWLWLDSSDEDPRAALSAWMTRRMPAVKDGRSPRRAVIVIDDAHGLLDADSARLVVDLVRRRDWMHLIVASRDRTELERMADGRVQVNTVTGGELLFRPYETAALAGHLGVSLTDEQIALLHTELGGWPAALRVVLEDMRAGAGGLPITRAERYLRNAVLPNLSESRPATLRMRFALAERLTYRLIHDLADGIPPQEIIDILECPGYTEIRHLADDVELILPAFVRRVLRGQYTAAHPDEARDMHRRLAAWYGSRPGPDHDLHAIQHARAAEDWTQFETHWTNAGASLAVTRPTEIQDVLRDLAVDVIKRHPSIAVLRGALAIRHPDEASGTQPTATRREFARLASTIKPSSLSRMPASDALLIGAGQLVDLRRHAEPGQHDTLASRITTAWDRRRERGESAGDALCWFYLQRGITDHLRLRYADASRWYRLSWQHRRPGDTIVGGSVAARLALVEATTGRHHDTEDWMRRHRGLARNAEASQESSGAIAAIAFQIHALDRLDASLAPLAVDVVRTAATSEFWAFAVFAQARWELVFGQPATGLGLIARAQADHRDDHGTAASLLLARANAELLLAIGQGHRAMQMLKTADTDSEHMLAVPLGWTHLLGANPAAARQVATRALIQDTTTLPDRIELLVIFAIAAARLGDVPDARDALKQAIAGALDNGIVRPLALPGRKGLQSLENTVNLTLPDEIGSRLAAVPPAYPEALSLIRLTRRERQIAVALRQGLSRDQIAEQMFVSINTVKKQLATLYRKLDVTSRSDALARLDQLGLSLDGTAALSVKRFSELV